VQLLEVKRRPLEAPGRLHAGNDERAAGGEQPERRLDGLDGADGVVDHGRAVLQPVAPAPRGQRGGADAARDLRDELVGCGGQDGVRAEPGGELGPGTGARGRPHLTVRVQVPQQRDGGERERARAVHQDGPRPGGRREQDGAQRYADRVGEHGRVVGDAVRDGEQLGGVRGEALGMRPGGRRAVPEVNRGGQVAGAEVAAPRVPAVPACLARRADAARNTGQPRVQHDPLARVKPPPDGLVAEHVRERHQRGERVVTGAVQQDLLHVGTAQAREGRFDAHPVTAWQRLLRDVLHANGREAGDERTPVHPAADGRGRLAREAVPEYERFHIAIMSPAWSAAGGPADCGRPQKKPSHIG
jgi:hypothetical protein